MSKDVELSIWEHLDELVKRLRIIFFSIIISTVVISALPADLTTFSNLNFSDYTPLLTLIIEKIQETLLPRDVSLIALTWIDTFYVYFLLAIAFGTLVSTPVIAYEFYKFVNPALLQRERRAAFVFVVAFSLLFTTGAVYAYFILLPITFKVLMRFVHSIGAIPFFAVKDFFSMIFVGTLGSGLFFTFPLLITFLVKVDLIGPETLRENRRTVLVVLLIVTAILTPDPTPLSMLLMAVPFYLLYELSIRIGAWIKGKEEGEKLIERGIYASERLLHTRP